MPDWEAALVRTLCCAVLTLAIGGCAGPQLFPPLSDATPMGQRSITGTWQGVASIREATVDLGPLLRRGRQDISIGGLGACAVTYSPPGAAAGAWSVACADDLGASGRWHLKDASDPGTGSVLEGQDTDGRAVLIEIGENQRRDDDEARFPWIFG